MNDQHHDQPPADPKAPRRVRTTTEKIVDLRDTVVANVDKYMAKELRLAQQLDTVRAARRAGQEEIARIDATLPPELRLQKQHPASEQRAETYDRANGQASAQ